MLERVLKSCYTKICAPDKKGVKMKAKVFNGISIFLCVTMALGLLLFSENKKINNQIEQKKPIQKLEKQKELEHEKIEEKIYNKSYQRGRATMLAQMGRTDLVGKQSEYMQNIEIPKEEEEKYKDLIDRAYVEGYHNASNIVNCPRFEH